MTEFSKDWCIAAAERERGHEVGAGMRFAGMNITIREPEPEFVKSRRTWKERFFSSPWRPWRWWKMVPDQEAKDLNQKVFQYGPNLNMTRAVFEEMKKSANTRPAQDKADG